MPKKPILIAQRSQRTHEITVKDAIDGQPSKTFSVVAQGLTPEQLVRMLKNLLEASQRRSGMFVREEEVRE